MKTKSASAAKAAINARYLTITINYIKLVSGNSNNTDTPESRIIQYIIDNMIIFSYLYPQHYMTFSIFKLLFVNYLFCLDTTDG